MNERMIISSQHWIRRQQRREQLRAATGLTLASMVIDYQLRVDEQTDIVERILDHEFAPLAAVDSTVRLG